LSTRSLGVLAYCAVGSPITAEELPVDAVPYFTVPVPDMAHAGGPSNLAKGLATHPERWGPLVDYRTDTRWYQLLERTETHDVWLLSWLPGQGTALHDHGPASGAFAVAAGTLTERVVTTKPSRPPVEVIRALNTGYCRAFGPHYVHQVTNTGAVPAVSVHVYTPALTVMNRYRLEPQGLRHLAVEQAGVDW
jgi:mannose-6-phosphate isomerase-like protein (cupin superfamily)